MSEHVLTLDGMRIQISKQPRCADLDHEQMIMNKLRVYKSAPERVTLQIRGEKMCATVTLDLQGAQWLLDALTAEAAEIRDADWEEINQQQRFPVPAGAKAAS